MTQVENAPDGSVLVWVPGGFFLMGSREGDLDEQPVHGVEVAGFWLGRHEVTNAQYARFLEATGAAKPDFWDDPGFNAPNQPVVGVRWPEAEGYCRWAGVRLPTEAEWEYAAAAGARQMRYGTATGQLTHDLANYGGAAGLDTFEDVTALVGTFPPNPFGLHDMAGNAWEWCGTPWEPYGGDPAAAVEETDERGFKVMRGGSWHFGAFHCRVSCRHRHRGHLHYDYVGFRVARSATAEEAGPPVAGHRK
jgi:formylglycine-generating enzyme required for sulfatase activity